MANRFLHTAWLFAVAMLFLSAIAMTAVRLWVPTLGKYRHDIEAIASELLGKEVTVSRLEATWRGVGPVLKLKGVQVADIRGGTAALEIEEVWVGLDAKRFLLDRELRPASIAIIGSEMMLVRDLDGTLFIDGLKSDDTALPVGLILALQRFSLHKMNLIWHDQQSGHPPTRLSGLTLSIDNRGERYSAFGYALLPGDLGYRVDLNAEILVSGKDPARWEGRCYVKGQSLAISEDLARRFSSRTAVSGIADLRLWVDFADADINSIVGEIEVNDLKLVAENGRHELDSLSAQLGWRRAAGGWQFAAQRIREGSRDPARQGVAFSLAGVSNQDGEFISGRFPQLVLQDVMPYLPFLPGLKERQREQLASYQPEGVLKEFKFDSKTGGSGFELLGFSTRFHGGGIRSAGSIPSISGLDGSIAGTIDAGVVSLDSSNIDIQADSLFRNTLHFNEIKGNITLKKAGNVLRVGTDSLRLDNDDLLLDARIHLDLPGDSAPVADMEIGVQYASLAALSTYLPARVMPKRGVAWLDSSLVSGDINGGSVILKGALDRLPFDGGDGRLEVSLPVSNSILDFSKDWTRIEGLDAQVEFSGRSMDINSHRGTIRNASLETVHAQIKNLGHPDLTIKGKVRGELPVMMAELESSPLGEIYGGFVDRVTTTGPAELDLDLFIPLADKKAPIAVRGKVLMTGNSLQIKNQPVRLDEIKGELAFNPDGLEGKTLHASMNGHPAVVDVWTDSERGVTNISLDGPLDLLNTLVGQEASYAALLSGSSNWHVVLGIGGLRSRKDIPVVDVEISSGLAGIAVTLPAPFGKPREETVPLQVKISRLAHREKQVALRYGERVRGLFELSGTGEGSQWSRGHLVLDGSAPVMPDIGRLNVSGHLERLRLSEWQQALTGGTGATTLPVEYDLVIDELEVMQHVLRDVTLHADQTGRVQNISLTGPSVKGEIQLSREGAGLAGVTMNMERIVLEKGAEPFEKGALGEPSSIPDLQITSKQFVYDGVDLGQFELQAKRGAESLRVDRLMTASKLIAVQATGEWRATGDSQISRFDIEASDGNFEDLLKLFDYQENISGGSLAGKLQASWPGTPLAFSPEKVEGKLELQISNGQLLDVEPGAGRIFGLLSLRTLQRRLSLDFSDIFKKGFSFDEIKGDFILDGGNAYTSNLQIEGPSARVEISGRIGLADRDYDQLVTIIPSLRSGLSLAGTIAGGPGVGAAMLLAEHLLAKQIEEATRFSQRQYAVTGPWSDPVFTRVKSTGEEAPAGKPVEQE